ncbi:LTA synthase family protein [Putridiphycobacter roseus]|uniref:LTA synthase family protein n=1 Tax=Putridiphycobacter roseus TaxID=2219161 RepID=UPI0011B77318|nr:alkaline phosphatase family protein [Putridiphycobacter roseus]
MLRLLLLWLVFFTVQRLLFILHYAGDIDVPLIELLTLPWHALRMDLSSFAYIMGIPLILLGLTALFHGKAQVISFKVVKGSVLFFGLITSILFSSELVSYHEWRTKLSSKIFVHFETPSEVFRTSSGSYTAWFIFYLIIQLLVFYLLYKYLILKFKPNFNLTSLPKRAIHFLTILLVGGFLFTMGIRGGLQKIPISATNAYYSQSQIVNDISVNSIWNFIHMTFQHFKKNIEGMYNCLEVNEAQNITKALYAYPETDSIKILKTTRPDIIFITLESWAANMIGVLGNPDHITPNFDQLTKEGLLFTQIYANSTTSETGHTAIYSGYPTVPGIAISSESAKCRQLPSIFKDLKAEGYNSSYYFGGSLAYGNIGGYLTEMNVDRQTDENDLSLTPKGDLGIHDEAMFPYFIKELKVAKSPYIYGVFSQSTHAPYDMPMDGIKNHPKNVEGYVNSMVYTDIQLKKLVDALRELPNFDNTLVVFVADHGKTNYNNNNIYSADFYHIPLLFWGGALKQDYVGKTRDKIGSQSDIVTTLLHQMDLPTTAYHWSKDLLNPSAPNWALTASTMSFGIVDTTGYAAYHTINEKMVHSTYKNETQTNASLKRSRALVETIYREFRNF